MTQLIQKVLDLLVGTETSNKARILTPPVSVTRPLKRLTERQLIQTESQIGAAIFGPVPKGHRREFFNLDASTWIWFDEWMDAKGHKQTTTVRYEVHENGILKVREGTRYDFIEGEELRNFTAAVNIYYERVCRTVYNHYGTPHAPRRHPV